MPNMKTVGQRNLKLLCGQAFFSQDPSDPWLAQNQWGSSTNHDQSKYQI
jgi:hypothetical protein